MLRDIIQKTYINLVQATKLFFPEMSGRGFYLLRRDLFFPLDFLGRCLRGYSSWLWNRILSIEIVLSMATSWRCGYSLFYLTDTTPTQPRFPPATIRPGSALKPHVTDVFIVFLTVFVSISTQTRKHSLPGTGTGVCVYLLTWEATSMVSLLTESRASRMDLLYMFMAYG